MSKVHLKTLIPVGTGRAPRAEGWCGHQGLLSDDPKQVTCSHCLTRIRNALNGARYGWRR